MGREGADSIMRLPLPLEAIGDSIVEMVLMLLLRVLLTSSIARS